MIIHVTQPNIPMLWESAVLECWEKGDEFKTQYDHPGDPPSKDCTAVLCCPTPLAEPRLHRIFPSGPKELEEYRREVVEGLHDERVRDGGYNYSYWRRMFLWPGSDASGDFILDQVERVLGLLTECPYSRRAQVVLWNPSTDLFDEHCPCLQRLWFRVYEDSLRMHVNIRSNCAYKAGFMNMYAFVGLQHYVAQKLSLRLGREISVGEYLHIADSWHIYGSYIRDDGPEGFKAFLNFVDKHPKVEDRTWRSDDEVIQAEFALAEKTR